MTRYGGYARVISVLVRLLPGELNSEYGESIVEDHARRYDEIRASEGRWAAHNFALRCIADLILTSVREHVRRAAGRASSSGMSRMSGASWLDFKLAFRTTARYPVLSLAGVLYRNYISRQLVAAAVTRRRGRSAAGR